MSFQALGNQAGARTQRAADDLQRALDGMVERGQVHVDDRSRYALAAQPTLVSGRVRMLRSGKAVVAADGYPTGVTVAEHHARALIDGDIVQLRLQLVAPDETPAGTVVEILQRDDAPIIGRFHHERGISFVAPERHRLNQDIVIPPGDQGAATHGDFVRVHLSEPPGEHHAPVGVVTEVCGQGGAGFEREIVLDSFGIPREFPTAAVTEAQQFGTEIPATAVTHRVDLRTLPLVTIDGVDARDFDDAVFAQPLPSGGWRLVVAIADVAHYVRPGSPLDESAAERGNSVYFPDGVIPMLPEALSNELCSLKPAVNRLCMVCDMQVSAAGQVSGQLFYEAVMRSAARLTYEQVEAFLRPGGGAAVAVPDLAVEVADSVRALDQLFETFRERRVQRGALDFESREVRIRFTPDGTIDQVAPVPRWQSHQLIEECMIAANVAAARFLEHHQLPGLYRVHEQPPADRVGELRTFLKGIGITVPGSDHEIAPPALQQVLQQLQQRDDGAVLEIMVLRVLSQAVYAPKNVGHFGLALEAYAHFTSPIRRYADLLIHRAIKHIIHSSRQSKQVQRVEGTPVFPREMLYPCDINDLGKFGEQTSMTERRAEDAVRDLEKWFKCRYMEGHLGEHYRGQIMAVTSFGLFVELEDLPVQGLIHISALGGDYYQLDQPTMQLVGEHSGVSFRLGQMLDVVVSRVDVADRHIDLVPAKALDGITRRARGGGGRDRRGSQAGRQNRSRGRPQGGRGRRR